MRCVLARCVAVIAIALLLPACALADEAMWKLLQAGGQVVLMRHALTDPGVGDPEGMRLQECATQRNLNAAGRAHAKRIGDAFRSRKLVVGRLLSSPWCRCIDTATLAFDEAPQPAPSLGNLFARPDLVATQIARLKLLASETPVRGNTVLVSHGSTILALTGISPGTGEMVVLTPEGRGHFRVAGRLTVD